MGLIAAAPTYSVSSQPEESFNKISRNSRRSLTRWGMSENGVKSAVLRMRQRFGEILREQMANTLATPVDVEDEIRYLFAMLS